MPALRPDVAEDPRPYDEWVRGREEWRPRQFTARPGLGPLHLVMVMSGEPPPETVRTLHALQRQTIGSWKPTVVLENSWQTGFTALVSVSGLHRASQRVRVEVAEDASSPALMLRLGLAANVGCSVSLLF